MKNILKTYLKAIAETTIRGDAREESYYPHLQALLEQFSGSDQQDISVTVLPKQTEAGNPDFRVWDGAQRIVGYIEAKQPGANLDRVETSEQLTRYRKTFPNLILTDFYEFRLYRDGVLVDRVSIGRPFVAKDLKKQPPLENVEAFQELMERFLSFSLPRVFTAEKLAVELAKRTRFLRDQVIAAEIKEQAAGRGDLYGFYKAFRQYLIAGLTEEQFADLYAQTIAYGLFAARTRAEGEFNRKLAFEHIPPTIGILRDVFRFISLGQLSPQMEVTVDDIAAVLNAADIRQIMHQYYREGKGEDPVVHFYETFLAQYDPQTRESRGVYYTPEPVVRYIVRSVHHVLQTHFALEDGLAARSVTVLDPAGGTLTFPAEAIRLAVNTFTEKYGEGGKISFIRNQILPNFYAFELMMAPYAIGHLKIGFLLEALGCPLREEDRFQLYLTNTLEMEDIAQVDLPLFSALSEESRLAGRIKREEPILVILGNPPYAGLSANRNEWTEKLLKEDLDGAQSYYTVDGQPLGERNPKWLQDDYVKFLRFAQWKIHKAGQGVVAMITNHGYLDNPTFRGMRQSLLRTFNEIYLLDLHGNSLRRETAPDGGEDKNVFDIRPGVVIAVFIKQRQAKGCRVFHADLYGARADKYAWLEAHHLGNAPYQEIQPQTPYYFFVPRTTGSIRHYLDWPAVNAIFPVNSVGIVTARDAFVIDFERRALENRILQFRNVDGLPDKVLKTAYHLKEKKRWQLNKVRQQIQGDQAWQRKIIPILYRPFDTRFIFYHKAMLERPRTEVMQHMLAGDNRGLITARSNKSDHMDHFFVTDQITEAKCGERTTQSALFPLYLYPQIQGQRDMFLQNKTANLAPQVLARLEAAYGLRPAPEEVLAYIYAVFYSPLYREKYADFLRIDFPRVPFPARHEPFRQMAALGQQLIELHLLKSRTLAVPGVKFQGAGENNRIETPRYQPETGRVYINADKYFEGITPAMWEYRIGGYQVLHKYLKDRKGRRLDDARRYIRIAAAIRETIALQAKLDALYPTVEKDVLSFTNKIP